MSIETNPATRPGRARRSPMRTDVVIVGVGLGGLGMAHILRDLAIPGARMVERDSVGASFRAAGHYQYLGDGGIAAARRLAS